MLEALEEALGGRLTLLRFLHQFDDARQGRVFGCAGRADIKDALLVQRASEDAPSPADLSTGMDSPVIGLSSTAEIARQDFAIYRDALAGLNQNGVADADLADFDLR